MKGVRYAKKYKEEVLACIMGKLIKKLVKVLILKSIVY